MKNTDPSLSEVAESLDHHHQSGGVRTPVIQILRSGPVYVGIFADAIKTITRWQTPTPLPHAPKAVLGVVGIQGHILTVLDPLILVGGAEGCDYSSGRLLVLRGDEQLALAIQEVGEKAKFSSSEPELARHGVRQLVITRFNHDREVLLLNEKELFASAIQGRERRRRRF